MKLTKNRKNIESKINRDEKLFGARSYQDPEVCKIY